MTWRQRIVSMAAATALASAAVSCANEPTTDKPEAPPSAESYAGEVEAWRARHETAYRVGYSTIAGLYPLEEGPNTAGSAATNQIVLPPGTPPTIGRFIRQGPRVRFEPASNAPVTLKSQPVTAAVDLKDDSVPDADELVVGDVKLVVHPSGDSRSIRVRDPNGPLAKGFLGFTWFPIDADYRVTGRFIKDAEPRRMKVLNTYGDIDEFSTEGVVEFSLLGQTLRLRPFTTRPNRFYVVFKDASSGHETYAAARFLYADLLNDGTTVLDFNEAYNPPCSFNPYTTCPIPLSENRLPIKVLAGEKDYPVHVPLKTQE